MELFCVASLGFEVRAWIVDLKSSFFFFFHFLFSFEMFIFILVPERMCRGLLGVGSLSAPCCRSRAAVYLVTTASPLPPPPPPPFLHLER